jgi:hypothetical protein
VRFCTGDGLPVGVALVAGELTADGAALELRVLRDGVVVSRADAVPLPLQPVTKSVARRVAAASTASG